jgi:diaminopimelate decarboxylase
LKCNSVAGVVRTIFEEGFGAEVMSDYEFWLARRLGMPADRVLLNGPNKSDALLRHAVREGSARSWWIRSRNLNASTALPTNAARRSRFSCG